MCGDMLFVGSLGYNVVDYDYRFCIRFLHYNLSSYRLEAYLMHNSMLYSRTEFNTRNI